RPWVPTLKYDVVEITPSDAEPVVLEKGESLRLRYGLYIHSGDTLEGKVAEAYKQFVSATK
ncbi:MAG TPA: hypothetical protein P5307_05545, partial [Pirellulaceae bacterium]|nr:hypothetical protein [Pirellulaceae bacterium]